jgi:uncharacterized protein YvpB
MITYAQQPRVPMHEHASRYGATSRGARPRGVPASEMMAWPIRQYPGTVDRRQLLKTGLAGGLALLMSAGLVLAATQKAARPIAGLTETPPASALLQGYIQPYQHHVLSCEAAVASMATRGLVSEQQILDQMPYNANPYLGFRGNVDGGQSLANGLADYGIYASPLARELQRFGYQTQVISGTTAPDLLRNSIGTLHLPVEVWVTHGLGDYPAITGSVGGDSFTLIDGEHARLAIGYDAYGIHTLDPIDGPRHDSWATFLAPWSRFNYMGIIVGATGQGAA